MDLSEKNIFNRPRLFILCCVGLVALVSIVAITVFFLNVRGAEQTMVPDLQGKDLIEALLELQQKELYPRIQLRYSGEANDKGRILEQDPRSGAIVKAGRRIRLVVSQGLLVSAVGNYIGRNVEDVRLELETLFSSNPLPLLKIREPLLYQYSDSEAGVILEQNPPPGTGIFSPVSLEFVVSRGLDNTTLTMPSLVGLHFNEALKKIAESGIQFSFSVRAGQRKQNSEMVIDQEPAAGQPIPANQSAKITIARPTQAELGETEVFKLFSYTLPENPYPLPSTVEVILPGGDRRTLAVIKTDGGELSLPYRLPKGSVIVLSMLNREIYRETVQ
jgi:beta-lactam-binding protein with PASTA domain